MPRLLSKADTAYVLLAQHHAEEVLICNIQREIERARLKLALCARLARENARNAWQEPVHYRAEYRRLVRDSMVDARYWQRYLQALTARA